MTPGRFPSDNPIVHMKCCSIATSSPSIMGVWTSRTLDLKVVWSYRAPGFFTRGAGAQQRLRGGNTLITESERGRIIEVSQAGETVWEYVNPRTIPGRPQMILGIMRASRLADGFPLEWARNPVWQQ